MATRTQRGQRQPKPARAPTREPLIVENFAEIWLRNLMDARYDELELAIPDAGPYRASWASKRCDRELQYSLAGTPASDPLSVADYWTFWLGSNIHGGMNMSLRQQGDGWIPDIDVDLRPIGIPGSGHADLVRFVDDQGEPFEMIEWEYIRDDDGGDIRFDRLGFAERAYLYGTSNVDGIWLTEGEWLPDRMFPTHVGEAKSVGGFAFKKAATTFQGAPEGPKHGAIIQGALVAWALSVDKLLIINFARENVAPSLAKAYSTSPVGRFAAEWKYSIESMKPLLESEVGRIRRAIAANEAGVLLPRMLHDPEVAAGGVVTHPKTGVWKLEIDGEIIDSGDTWMCNYCPHQELCQKDGKGGAE